MDGFNYIEDHFETTVKPRILEQYKESGRWQACLEAVVRKLQAVEDSAFIISKAIDFKTETPTGAKLDWVAGLINVKRFSGESDEAFFLRFESMCGANTAGTPNNVIYNTAILSNDPRPQYMDEATATFFIYAGPRSENTVPDGETFDYESGDTSCVSGGNQLLARQVKNLAPAGVLGLVGAAIQVGVAEGDKLLLADAQGRLILMVADENPDEPVVRITTELLDEIQTETGDYIVTE